MNLNIGFPLNETITDAVVDQLIVFDPSLGERSREDIPRTCTANRILAAVGINRVKTAKYLILEGTLVAAIGGGLGVAIAIA